MAKKSTKAKAAFALIRAKTKSDIELLDNLKKATGEKTATGALMRAGESFLHQVKVIQDLKKENTDQEKHIRELTGIVQFAFNGMQNLMSYGSKKFPKGKYPQGDLFNQE